MESLGGGGGGGHDKPRPVPRPHRNHQRGGTGTGHKGKSYPAQAQDSSSDGEDLDCPCDQKLCAFENASCERTNGAAGTATLGLTPDENHISPIENLDNTISRLYSYLSGSEGDVETDHPLTPPNRGGGGGTGTQEKWERRRSRSPTSIPSSRSSSMSRSDSDPDLVVPHHHHSHHRGHHPGHHHHPPPIRVGTLERGLGVDGGGRGTIDRRTLDSACSAETGENVYSRINDTATLPMVPPLPPPIPLLPGDDLVAGGPAVPPRRPHSKRYTRHAADSHRRGTYTEVESDFEPHYLVTTASGTVFIPHGPPHGSPPSSPPLPFPRTVPRTNSLPHQPQLPAQPPPPSQPPPAIPHPTITDLLNNAQPPRSGVYDRAPSNDYAHTNLPTSTSTDRIKHQLKELEDTWARTNVQYPPANNLNMPPLPTYPSIQNDFRDYNSRFGTASYRVKKHFRGRCSWRGVALVLLLITIALTATVAYFIAMEIYNMKWAAKQHPLNHDLNSTRGATRRPGQKGLSPVTISPHVIVQYPLGKPLEQEIPPHQFWRTQFYMPQSQFVKYNFSLPTTALVGVYGRRNVQPTHTQYDFFHVLDGSKLNGAREKRALVKRGTTDPGPKDSAFIHYMEAGLWFVFLYNDGDESQKVSFIGSQYTEEVSDCPESCHGRGDCVSGSCVCFAGYTGWDCGQTVCPVLCKGNGIYVRGACQCYPGWKGKECDVPEDECEVPSCHGNGKCVNGECICFPGYGGQDCGKVDCLMPNCSGNGVCVEAVCHCWRGYTGPDCSLTEPDNVTVCSPNCSGRGVFYPIHQNCTCTPGWTGPQCEIEVCNLECAHGECENQRCVCDPGWSGALCDQLECDRRCTAHGYCNNGTCVCKPGWNGRHCTLSGCHNDCNNNGACQLFADGWRCSCRDGWKGIACEVAMEIECEDNVDDDRDGLTDCMDPDCCISVSCRESVHCLASPDPMEILLRKQPPSTTASFYDRMRFLVEDNSVQNYATLSSFNMSQVSVIRGKVIATDKSPLIGVRVSVVTQPLYGFTLSRELGLFDILVNGGGSVTLQFQRKPFQIKKTTVMVPWNRMVTMEPVVLILEDESEPQEAVCTLEHDHYVMKPVVLSTWQHTQLGACPSKSTIIPESQVLQESLQMPGTGVYLVYHSSETQGYMSTIMIQLTPAHIPANLAIVHLRVSVEGLVYEKVFEADRGLKYKFAWDRRNAYNQKVYGIVSASVGVGYQYEGCESIFWEMQSATMSGYDITSSEIGRWNLHIHHTYNFQEGILHKGDGTNIYLKERPRKVVNVLGNGKQRRVDCRSCDGKAEDSRLMAPVALASGRDGSLYVGDFNHIRKLSANRQDVASILELSMSEVPYKYFMTVSPLDGKLYISDYQSKHILRVKTMGAVRDLAQNMEVIAGTGDQCVPGDRKKCGDGGPAINADLFYPKGIAINKDGIVYFADGANIRSFDREAVIQTVIGSQGQPVHYEPIPCGRVVSVDEITLSWPTALAVNPLDDTLHILDNNMVFKVTKDGKILIVAGRPLHCPPKNPNFNPLLSEDQAGPKLATDVILESPQHITFAPNGYLYIVESDGKFINRIREVSTDGTISHYAGAKSKCSCREEGCKCYDGKEVLATKILLSSPTAITVTPDNVLHVSDMGNMRIYSVVATLPEPDSYGQYEVLYPQTQDLYMFNRYGQHIATKNLITDQYVYNFTYNVNSYYGKLVRVTDSGNNRLTIRRDYNSEAKEITPPGGQKCKFIMDNMGQLHIFIAADNSTTKFTYTNTGLLETKETSEGHTFLYDYDANGRLASVTQPTGEHTALSTDVDPTGAIARLSTDRKDKVALATNGNMLSVLHGRAKTKVSYLHDGALVVEYPFNMAITMETNPHPLLSTDHQLHVKRKIILPNNLVHRLEWRYYLRRTGRTKKTKTIDRIGRRMRVGKVPASRHVNRHRHAGAPDEDLHDSPSAGEGGYEGKYLLVNGENLLTMEYERETHSETVYDKEGDELVTVLYNSAGQPMNFLPRTPLLPLNITYDDSGQLVQWEWGDINLVNIYDDRTGYLTERKFANRATFRYIYKSGTKPTDVILPSGKQYVLRYDAYGNLAEVLMPGLTKHHFHSLTTLQLHRKMYIPPDTHSPFIMDYDSSGKLIQVLYPSGARRLNYYYTDFGLPTAIYHDWTDVQYEYYESEGVLKSVSLKNRVAFNYSCVMEYRPAAALVKHHSVSFNDTGFNLLNANFLYHYDQHFRVVSMETDIGGHIFKPLNFSYSMDTGRLERVKSFQFEYPRIHRNIVRDSNMEIVREYDTYERLTDVWYKFNNYMVFSLEVKYDALNRIHQWRRKVGTSDLKAYEYVYDIDNNLMEVVMNGQQTWKFEHDANNNIVKIAYHAESHRVGVNIRNQVETSNGEKYEFDKDGFMVGRDNECFEYNSQGQLVRAFEVGKYDIYYFYDPEGRLVARKDELGGYLTQFFYADITHKDRITHVYEHSTSLVTMLYYDNHGKLFAMEQDNRYFYIALDPMGSPIVIFNAVGSVVKQMSYDPLGLQLTDSAPEFHFMFGFQCGIVDHIPKLIHYRRRVYDPNIGRWIGPDYVQMMRNLDKIDTTPEIVNIYQYRDLVNKHLEGFNMMMDISNWLTALGYDLDSLIPRVSFSGRIRPGRSSRREDAQTRLIPVTSAFECAFRRDMQNFIDISTVPKSKVTSEEEGDKIVKSYAPFQYIFGEGVLLTVVDGKVVVNVLDSANEVLSLLATTLFNESKVVGLHYTIHARDVHYFVKESLDDAVADVRDLSLRTEDTIGGINVSVHRVHETSEIMKHVDIRLHGNHTVLNLRYGISVWHERQRILRHARERAVAGAWTLERQLAQAHRKSLHQWTRTQRDELLKTGAVTGMRPVYIRDVEKQPELADDPKNIRFVAAESAAPESAAQSAAQPPGEGTEDASRRR